MLQFQNSNAFRIYHPTRPEESWCGADLLVWIRRNDGLSRFLAIQAKKLYPKGTYKSLNHRTPAGARQIDLLNQFARQYHAIPLYLLYNHFDSANPHHYWRCCKPFDIEQLGCTLVPSWKIEDAIRPHRRGRRSFTAIHTYPPSRPWRCAFDCDRPDRQLTALATPAHQALSTPIKPGEEEAEFPDAHPEALPIDLPLDLFKTAEPLPTAALDWLCQQINERVGRDRRDPLRPKHDTLYPRKLLIVDNADTPDETEAER